MNITDNLHHDVYPAIDPSGALKTSATGRTVLITGAGRGIGKGIALSFACAGASTLVLVSRSLPELEAVKEEILALNFTPPPKVITQVADVISEDSVRALFQGLSDDGVVVDILVNNAGTMEHPNSVHETDPTEWWRTWEVNIKGTYLPTHFFLKGRLVSESSTSPCTVICISSMAGVVTRPGVSAYGPAKSAVNRFAEFLHAEYADKGVRAFAVHPGGVLTKLARDVQPEDRLHLFVDQPGLIGGFCVWLAGARGADPFRGKYLSCNWDVGEMLGAAETKGKDPNWLLMKLVL